MTQLRLYKWFWGTFGAWCFTVTVGAWALIYSPFHFGSQTISKFSLDINGTTSQGEISSTHERMDQCLAASSQQWKEEGWKIVSPNTNLAGIFFNLPQKFHASIDPLIQVRVFQNSTHFRVLALWHDFRDGQTYQWTSDLSRKALQTQDPANVDFPLKPPAEAFDIFNEKTKNISTSTWSIKSTGNPDRIFAHICSLQGFSKKELPTPAGKTAYLLQKGTTQLLGIADQEGIKTTISLMWLSRI